VSEPIGGPYLLPEDEHPFSLALFRKRDMALVWAVSVLKPSHGLMRLLEIPPTMEWIGEEVDATILAPEEWPRGWRATL
jgi:hypothetical protein